MKRILTLLAALLFAASLATALVPATPQADLTLDQVLDITPFWQQDFFTYTCDAPSEGGPWPCTWDWQCQDFYFLPPGSRCHNPTGQNCAGQC